MTTLKPVHTCTLPDSRRIVGIVLDTAPSSGIDGPPPADTVWTDVLDLGIQGRGWNASELNSPFNRCVKHKPMIVHLHGHCQWQLGATAAWPVCGQSVVSCRSAVASRGWLQLVQYLI